MLNNDLTGIDETLDELENNHKAREPQLPESPASINIKFWANGYGVMLTMRDEEVSTLFNKFKVMLNLIEKAGYKPKWDEEPIRVLPKAQPEKQAPVCGVHGSVMEWKTGIAKKTGRPYAFWSCPTKNADGTFCKYTPPPEEKDWTYKAT